MSDISRDELLGAVTWTHPRDRETHMTPPPLRVRQAQRPPREVHFDRVGAGESWVTLWEWFAIYEPTPGSYGDGARRNAAGWYSRSSSFRLPSWMAASAATAWQGLAAQDVIVVLPPADLPKDVQRTLGGKAP